MTEFETRVLAALESIAADAKASRDALEAIKGQLDAQRQILDSVTCGGSAVITTLA